MALFIAFIVTATASGRKAIDREMLFFPLAFAASLLPLYVAWAVLWTSGDTIFLMYCCLALVPALLLQWAPTLFSRGGRERPCIRNKTSTPTLSAKLLPILMYYQFEENPDSRKVLHAGSMST